MAAGPDPGAAVPEHWLAVLEAVAAVCADEDSDSAPTGHIARRLPATRSLPTRTLLRALRRHGYVRTTGASVDGAPLRWALTATGRTVACRKAGRGSHLSAPPRTDRR
jgi:hypothetical protein